MSKILDFFAAGQKRIVLVCDGKGAAMTTVVRGRILIVDDDPRWREQPAEMLVRQGFYVEAVANVTEAFKRLEETLFHVIILDIRLQDVDNNTDGVGMLKELAERGLGESIKVIMLSAHGTKENIRLAFRNYKVADFLSKEEFDEQFLPTVEKVFAEQVNMNSSLEIYGQSDQLEQAVQGLEIRGVRVESETPLYNRLVLEAEDLLRRLFYSAESIMVNPLTSTPSRSGTNVLRVQPFFSSGGGHTLVVKFGHMRRIEEEVKRFHEYVSSFVSGARHTTIVKVAYTPLLGGIAYSLLGSSANNWVDFGQFYRQNEIGKIRAALHQLFHSTCGAWYASPGMMRPRDLLTDYQKQFGCTLAQLEHEVRGSLPQVQEQEDKLIFGALAGNRLFPNPFIALRGKKLVYPTYESITHGDLNQHNILVEDAEDMWMIDFEKTGRSHILQDVATLDAVVRFQLLEENDATLPERLQMEEALGRINKFSQLDTLAPTLRTRNAALAKAYATTLALRKLAWWTIDQNPSDDMKEYYTALLLNALNTLQFFSLSKRQREHALLSASLLVSKSRL